MEAVENILDTLDLSRDDMVALVATREERIADLEAFAEYVLKNSGERTIRDKAAEVLGR